MTYTHCAVDVTDVNFPIYKQIDVYPSSKYFYLRFTSIYVEIGNFFHRPQYTRVDIT